MRTLFDNISSGVKKIARSMQVKSNGLHTMDEILLQLQTAYGVGRNRGIGWLSALGSIQYYNMVAPISIGVDLIAQQCADIPLSIWDKKNKVWLKDGDVQGTPQKMFDLFRKVDYTQTYSSFIKSQVAYKIITGNNFTIVVTGGISGEPIEIITAKPQNIIVLNSTTSYAHGYRWTDGSRTMDFKLDLATMRYVGVDKFENRWELAHSKEFNPLANSGNIWGMSRLTPIYNEMEQYVEGLIHNKALLKEGARPTGVLTFDTEIDDDQCEKMRVDVMNFYSGSSNAGKILTFQGDGARFENFSISPRDMDFANLYDRIERTLYNRLNIPAPLYKDSAMTYNNLDSALYQLYILASNPLLSEYLLELDNLLEDKYKDASLYTFGIDPADVEALKARQTEDDMKLAKTAFITVNENRKLFGYEPIDDKGDILYIPTGLNEFGKEEGKNNGNFGNNDNADEEVDTKQKDGKVKGKDKKETKSLYENIKTLVDLMKNQGEKQEEIDKTVENIYGRD